MAETTFYDVKKKTSVTAKITGKAVYDGSRGKRFALRGKTDDNRNLTKFVSKEVYEGAEAPSEN